MLSVPAGDTTGSYDQQFTATFVAAVFPEDLFCRQAQSGRKRLYCLSDK